MKALVLAYSTIGCTGLQAVLDHGFDVQAVITHTDDPAETQWFESVAELAASRSIPVHAPLDVNHPLWVETIRAMAPDVIFSFYYRNLVGPEILAIPPQGALNLHGSMLPAYRGRCPLNWVLVNGEAETGVTLHYMVKKPDAGDIVSQKAFPIAENDTARDLHAKAVTTAQTLLNEALPLVLAGTAPRIPQDHARATVFPGRGQTDGEIDWNRPSETIRNLVRAVTRPYPGAFTHIGTRKILVWSATVLELSHDVRPGTILDAAPLTVAAGRNALRIDSGQSEDGVFMSGTQLASELRLVKG
ncbi:MAG: formyltransferase, partial [Deltaproteobacteria bacterium]|nr:formyltransferase [Deltaproteobacteria bacterium]